MRLKKKILDLKFYKRNDLISKTIYDLYIENNNYIEEENSETPFILSLLENLKQQYKLNDNFPIEKRGGSYFLNISRGSLLWLRDKITTKEQQLTIFARQSLQWAIDDGYVDDINTSLIIINRILTLKIQFIIEDKIESLDIQIII